MNKVPRSVTRALTVAAVSTSFMIVGSAVASAQTTQLALDPGCLQAGAEALLADPVGVLISDIHDPAGTIHAEVACVEDVLGL